jgi:hypothetical protein
MGVTPLSMRIVLVLSAAVLVIVIEDPANDYFDYEHEHENIFTACNPETYVFEPYPKMD